MAEGSDSGGGIISTILSGVGEVLKMLFEAAWEFLARAVPFILWVIAAIIILPCVFVAGEIYPKWQEWGEDF